MQIEKPYYRSCLQIGRKILVCRELIDVIRLLSSRVVDDRKSKLINYPTVMIVLERYENTQSRERLWRKFSKHCSESVYS